MTLPDDNLRFDADGLVSAPIQDAATGTLLMVGWMNAEAVDRTRETGFVHFWSRSRGRLWKKGESSGHVLRVEEMRVNCELNSLLIEVTPSGAVCHDGYDTCYYRRIEPDGSLTVVRDRAFDPADVYGDGGIAMLTRDWFRALAWLRDTDFTAESSTSRRLRASDSAHPARIVDELRELAGVVDGSHRHGTVEDDLFLEAGQVLYWLACEATHAQLDWSAVRPDLALDVPAAEETDDRSLVSLLTAKAAAFDAVFESADAATIHDAMRLVATTVASRGIAPVDLVRRELDEMRAKPYLASVLPPSG